MSTFRNPVGPQPSGVYWRRRLMVGLGLLAVVVVTALIVARPGSGDVAAKKSAVVATHTAAAVAPRNEGDPCAPASIKLEPVTDKGEYGPGEDPMIALRITNTAAVACTMNVGTTLQEFRITSGSELIWSSKDCQKDPVDNSVILQPGVAQSTSAIPWDRTRSSKSTCGAERNKVTAAGASYHLQVFVGALKSPNTAQFILR